MTANTPPPPPVTASATPEARPLAAAVWMLGSILAFTAMAVAVRQIGTFHDTFEIMAIRSLVGLALVVLVAGAAGRLHEISSTRLPGHLLRNIVHFTGQNLWMLAITLAPLAQVIAIEFTAPVWVVLLAPLLLGERLTGRRVLAAALGFAGVLVVAKPDISDVDPGLLAAAGSALAFALTTIATKRLTRAEGIVSILFWLTLLQSVFGIALAAWDGAVTWPTTATLPWLGLIGLCGIVAHTSLTSALRLAPASLVMPLDFARLPLAALAGAALYGEPLGMALLFGAGLIILANLLNIRSSESGKPQGQASRFDDVAS